MDIEIYGDIGETWGGEGITAKQVVDQLTTVPLTDSSLNVRINSDGGSCKDGLAIFNRLREFSNKRKAIQSDFALNTYNDGVALSAGATIFMAGDKRIMTQGSQLMVHRAWTFCGGNSEELAKVQAILDRIDTDLLNLYASRSGTKPETMKSLLWQETYFTADEAVKSNLATEKIDLTVANSSNKPTGSMKSFVIACKARKPDASYQAIMRAKMNRSRIRKLNSEKKNLNSLSKGGIEFIDLVISEMEDSLLNSDLTLSTAI